MRSTSMTRNRAPNVRGKRSTPIEASLRAALATSTFLICLDDWTEESGATRIVPASHLGPAPAETWEDRTEKMLQPVEGEVRVVCGVGSIICIHGDLHHGGCANHTQRRRRALQLSFCCPATRPQYE